MAQLERGERMSETPKSQISPEQLVRVDEAYWSPPASHAIKISHDQEESLGPPHNKKSVLTKVKEKAKKLRHSLSGKKKHEHDPDDDHSTPPWGGTLGDESNDEPDDDPEYLGAPMYESEAAPEALKETARQHPRAEPVLSENHKVPNRMKKEAAPENDEHVSPSMTVTETVSEKLAPAYAAMSDATHKIASKLAGLAIATQEPQERAPFRTARIEAKKMSGDSARLSPQTWDKGISVKEYFLHKLEPGEDERALSEAITEAISPRNENGDTGVVEKVKEAVTSFFRQEETSHAMAKCKSLPSASVNIPNSTQLNRIASTNAHSSRAHYSSPAIPVSSNTYEVYEEENHGKILQAN